MTLQHAIDRLNERGYRYSATLGVWTDPNGYNAVICWDRVGELYMPFAERTGYSIDTSVRLHNSSAYEQSAVVTDAQQWQRSDNSWAMPGKPTGTQPAWAQR